MDILAILEGHLDFIQRFYNSAASVFEITKQKIVANEEPFVPKYPPGDYDGYEYQGEWNEADACLRVIGQSALGLVATAIHDYLREFTMRECEITAQQELSGCLKPYKQGSTFEAYVEFIMQNTSFNSAASPVTQNEIEQIILSRNDFTHDTTIDRVWPRQSATHFQKYPVSNFADEMELAVMKDEDGSPAFPLALRVTRENLTASIKRVRMFCTFIEAQRTKW
jgi:hypothetical protein